MRITLFGVQSAALTVGTILAAIVLAPAGWTLLRATPLFGLGVSLGIAAALLVCVLNLRDLLRGPDPGRPLIASWQRWVLVGAVPASLIGSVLDCGGFRGCTPVCAFLDTHAVPTLIALALLYLLVPKPAVLIVFTAGCFVLLVPSCRCSNPGNQFWIDLLGLSPSCFGAPFTIGMMVAGTLSTGRRLVATALVGWVSSLGELGFHIGHHYHHWPW